MEEIDFHPLENGKAEQVLLPHLPETHTIHMALYANITNAEFLHAQLLQGNTEFEYAFLDAQVLLSREHAFAACWRAINDRRAGKLKTRNVHSEIVFALSPNNNIAESFRRHGITPDTKELLAIKVAPSSQHSQIASHIEQIIQGDIIAFNEYNMVAVRDGSRIKKAYRLKEPGSDGAAMEKWWREAEAGVIGSMALKGS